MGWTRHLQHNDVKYKIGNYKFLKNEHRAKSTPLKWSQLASSGIPAVSSDSSLKGKISAITTAITFLCGCVSMCVLYFHLNELLCFLTDWTAHSKLCINLYLTRQVSLRARFSLSRTVCSHPHSHTHSYPKAAQHNHWLICWPPSSSTGAVEG